MLSLVGQLLVSAGSKGPAAELAGFRSALDPFRDLTANQLAKELHKLTEQPKAGKRGAKLSPAEVDALIAEVRALYDRAGSSTTTPAEVEERTKALSQLGKADVLRAAEAVGLQGMKSKTIAAVAAEIRKRIEGRMGTGQRMGMIEVVVGGEGQ
jgi:hypothetical protein